MPWTAPWDSCRTARKKPLSSGEVFGDKYLSMIDGLAYGPREGLRHIKIYTVASGDTFETISRKTMGTSTQAKKLSQLNGLPEGSPLVPGVKIKTIY